MKSLSFCILFLSINILWSQNEPMISPASQNVSTIHLSSQSPVKDQGNGNNCSAFGVAAALETLPNMPKDISENFLYSAHKFDEYKNEREITIGNFLKSYIISLPKYGILTEGQLPYPKVPATKWDQYDSELFKALKESTTGPLSFEYKYKSLAKYITLDAYQYLGLQESKNVGYLKYLLDNGIKAIPVSYTIYRPAWNNYSTMKYTTITPNFGYGVLMKDNSYAFYSEVKKEYPDINQRILSQNFTYHRLDKDPNNYGGHVVTIIGYDSEGFIIKNSWGKGWRFFGYERVSYDFHELFAYEALILSKVSYKR
ncbi:hypothetical protein H2O64_11380 [Kordia sp. YSTF-M3]|uniref:Peptidase C1A papain C-terminal domain-containing protein n=1 Tax=Kordia aestuariivivens TaxID=2759037 RepID=A0ABR7Q9N4_9FLAO|nr:C1 family peptidase [Kordia aestuariivivens]MBC8755279.1 hypothetical protein [Kordia aestuariivivens]